MGSHVPRNPIQMASWSKSMAERLAVRRDTRDFALAFDNVKETLEH